MKMFAECHLRWMSEASFAISIIPIEGWNFSSGALTFFINQSAKFLGPSYHFVCAVHPGARRIRKSTLTRGACHSFQFKELCPKTRNEWRGQQMKLLEMQELCGTLRLSGFSEESAFLAFFQTGKSDASENSDNVYQQNAAMRGRKPNAKVALSRNFLPRAANKPALPSISSQ